MTHLALQRILLPSVQINSLTTGSITLNSSKPSTDKIIAGFIAGGNTNSNVGYDTVDKWLLATEVRSTLATGLSISMYDAGTGFSNLNIAGYVPPGYSAGYQTVINKFVRGTDTRSTLASGLSSGRYATGGLESLSAGYATGGQPSAGNRVSTVDKYAFSDDSRSTLGTGLTTAVVYHASFNSFVAGYSANGYNNSGVGTTAIQKLTFSDDSHSTLSGTTGNAVWNSSGFHSSTHGYLVGGSDVSSNYYGAMYKIAFSDDSVTTLNFRTFDGERGSASCGAFQNSVAGFVGGGNDVGTTKTTMRKYLFTTEAHTNLYYGLSAATNNNQGAFEY